MSSTYIHDTTLIIEFNIFKKLQIFAQKKQAVEWCKDNNIKPLRIIKLATRFQESYCLDMGRNCFLEEN